MYNNYTKDRLRNLQEHIVVEMLHTERLVRTTLLPLGTTVTATLMKAGYAQAMNQARDRWGHPRLQYRDNDFLALAEGRHGGRERNAALRHWFTDRGAPLILPGATTVRYRGSEDDPSVTYELSEAYPAVKARDVFDMRLRQAGWTAVPTDVLKIYDTKHLRRWDIEKLDEWRPPSLDVVRWRDQWIHEDGSVMEVVLTYLATVVTDDHAGPIPLSVTVSWVPKDRLDVLTSRTVKE
jgi:hypothetical protein